MGGPPSVVVKVRPLTAADDHFAAELHAAVLPDGFFPALGNRFLKAYYGSFRRSPHGIGLVAYADGSPAGVLVGTSDDEAHYRWVVRQAWWRLVGPAVVGLVRRPRLMTSFVRTRARRYLRGAARLSTAGEGTALPRSDHRIGTVTHLAITDHFRSEGIGAALVERFIREARDAGTTRLQVVTRAGDDGAGGFYAAIGWRSAGTRTNLDGAPYDRFMMDL